MPDMEESLGSGGVVKKKSSSGCLIIKKKGDIGFRGGASHMEKKSSRMITGEFGSTDESLDQFRRNVDDSMPDEPIVYSRRVSESERKRNRLDLFEFDEYDEFDEKRMRHEYMEMLGRSGGSKEFSGGGSSRGVMVEKRKHSYFDGSAGGFSGRSKFGDHGVKRRYDDEDDADLPISLLRSKKEESAGPIRLQGKSGVLKVMVNKKKKMDVPSVRKFDRPIVENRKGIKSEDSFREEIPVRPPVYLGSKKAEKRAAMPEGKESQVTLQKLKLGRHKKSENSERDGTEVKLRKSSLGQSIKDGDDRSDWTDTSPKLAIPSLAGGCSAKAVKREEKGSSLCGNATPVKSKEKKITSASDDKTPEKGNEGKAKRGGSTEKQLLRERIREMLINAGWKIDYRPRRDRDYLDAVYINPIGTAYWSIIKAYDALQKQLPEVDDVNKQDGESSFTPLSDDLIKKLTRKTRKKIEEEMKKKSAGKGEGSSGVKKSKKAVSKVPHEDSDDDRQEEKLSSFIRQNGKAKKSRLHELDSDSGHDLSDDSWEEKRQASSGVVQARKSRKIGRCTLLVRNSEEGQNSDSDGYVPYPGKRTLLSWLIDSEKVQLSEKVQYMNRRRTRVKLEGWITREGIHCGCCSKILTLSKFELHAGSKLRQPFQNIILESGLSLLQCLIDAWDEQDESVLKDFYAVDVDGGDPDDDTCAICADGGDLICCDGCPSTFHQTCLGIQMLPSGDWHCPNCTCKFCGTMGGNVAEKDTASASELSMCNHCEKTYHKLCGNRMANSVGSSDSLSTSFCGKKCQEIYDHMQKILGLKNELEAGFSWSLLHRTDLNSDTENRGYPQRVECNSKLAVALSVMDECFLPIIDRRSGINQIHNVVYNCGSNFSRLNYCGFYTVVLERGDEIISAASIRLRGTQLAEMPLIGTRHIYRRQGMCRRLLSAIESVLCHLKIEKLIIPAIAEHMQTWTGAFGFKPLKDSHRKEIKLLNMLVFPGADMLQKPLVKQGTSEDAEGSTSNDSSPQSPRLMVTSDMDSSRKETKEHVDIASSRMNETIDEVNPIQPVASASVSQNNTTESTDSKHASGDGSCGEENTCVESQIMKSECQSPSSDATESLQFDKSLPHNPVIDDIQPSSKDLAGNNLDVNSTQSQDPENGIEAESNLQELAEASYDEKDVEIQAVGFSSFKFSGGESNELVEDGACTGNEPGSILEGSSNAAAEQASIKFAHVPSPSNSADHVTLSSPGLNQYKTVDSEVCNGNDGGRSDTTDCDLSEDASAQTVEELRENVDPGSVSPFQSYNGKATDPFTDSKLHNIVEIENGLPTSASDSRIEADLVERKVDSIMSDNAIVVNEKVPCVEHSFGSSPRPLMADAIEAIQNSDPHACLEDNSKQSASFSTDLAHNSNQLASVTKAVVLGASWNVSTPAATDQNATVHQYENEGT